MGDSNICCKSTDVVERSDIIIGSDNTRGRDRPKLTLDAVVKKDMIELNLGEYLAIDRAQWHKKDSCSRLQLIRTKVWLFSGLKPSST